VNETVVVLGFFALMALLVSRILREPRKQDSQTPQVKKDERVPVAGNERASH
jgi:flagellar biogenesis protein FliO